MDKDFICLSCKWSIENGDSKNKVYCRKVGFACNGHQTRPTHICEDYEEEVTE